MLVAKRFVCFLRLFVKIIEDIKSEYIGISSLNSVIITVALNLKFSIQWFIEL